MSAADAKLKIDAIDDEIAALYVKRMELASEVAADSDRNVAETDGTLVEKATVSRVTKSMPEGMKLYAKQLFDTIYNTSRAYGMESAGLPSKIRSAIDDALVKGEERFPVSATVACQGVAGAYAQIAADKMFPISDILYFKDWKIATFSLIGNAFTLSLTFAVNAVIDNIVLLILLPIVLTIIFLVITYFIKKIYDYSRIKIKQEHE